ncbi:MAG TPA: family 1 glycosylhydrolase [Casimicrobiaceae bacterium]|nr:family 1 glycosylhydrolase [Casimicrobiaceae bacterium]
MERKASTPTSSLPLWGGIEPTLNRVGDRYYNQLERSGHHARISDLDACADLGIRTLRYPVLWEQTMPAAAQDADWRWPDERLARLRELGITPIVGLVHHGSGPRHTSLLDDQFPAKLADYATCVASRYPWVEHYTPVNEPLTTALFSGLYGVWYPHGRCDRAFTKALLMQCRGVALAMRAIRAINPRAKLVQTDDLGKTYSTPALRYQADFNNERRWLAWDLLCGAVDAHHPLWDWLIRQGGATRAQLTWFVQHPCPPDTIGINYYVTSERYLDEDVDTYAPCYHGGNGRHRYADVEAVRCPVARDGIGALLAEAASRYRLPLAITEAHIDATREDQLRWIAEIWATATDLRNSGMDISGVTLWALFGAFDWNSLVTNASGYYESGAFDVRAIPPRPTALAALAKSLVAGDPLDHPLLSVRGWWGRSARFYTPPVGLNAITHALAESEVAAGAAPLLITGATGTLGRAFARICGQRGIDYRLLTRNELDIADAVSVDAALKQYEPWAVVNTAGYVRVDDAERESMLCFRENTRGAETLASACAARGAAFLTFSSDLVFDGSSSEPYIETDVPAPLNVYGRSKAEAELRVLDRYPEALVVRTSAFFGPWDDHNYVTAALRALRSRLPFLAAGDMIMSPTYVPDLVNVSLDLLIDRTAGIWHLSNGDAVTWAEFAVRAAKAAGLRADSLIVCSTAALELAARRPRYSALTSARSMLMPSLTDALTRYVSARPEVRAPRGGRWKERDEFAAA